MNRAATDPPDHFDELTLLLRRDGPAAASNRLVALAELQGQPRALLEALLLKARIELGIPAVPPRSLSSLPEPQRTQYEDRYVAALRQVGQQLLDAGDIPAAWPYFRVLGEKEQVARAIDAYEPAEGGDDRLGTLIDIAFHQGVHPSRGFQWILDHYGICSAITAFEHLPPDEPIRSAAADRLTRSLHHQLLFSLRSEIGRREGLEPPNDASLLQLLNGRDWLFEDEAYHIDTSHLAAVVRMSTLLSDPETLSLALDLTTYGRRLSHRYQYAGEPPFEDLYADHAVYLNALLGHDVEHAIHHFQAKLAPPDPDSDDPMGSIPAQILVRLLARLGRTEDAIAVFSEHLAGVPESMLLCPSLPQLCIEAGRPDLLAEHARRAGDLPLFTAALLEQAAGGGQAISTNRGFS